MNTTVSSRGELQANQLRGTYKQSGMDIGTPRQSDELTLSHQYYHRTSQLGKPALSPLGARVICLFPFRARQADPEPI
jgi:hypothetical protein